MSETLQRTPLYEAHKLCGARLVPFAGWEMPVQYKGILDECKFVRSNVGIFDISHMGRVFFRGPNAESYLSSLTSNNVAALTSGNAHYSLLTNPEGGIIDDIIVYRIADQEFMVVINAGNTDKDLLWFSSKLSEGVTLDNQTSQTAMIAVQGPNAPELVGKLTGADLSKVSRFQYLEHSIGGIDAILCRTGYTGEDGFEIIVSSGEANALWNLLIENGAAPCGLGSRDALRIEAGYPLYGHEIDDTTTPVEAALMWVVKLDGRQFTGSDVITKVKADGAGRKLVGIKLGERIVPRQGYNLLCDGELVGTVTSGIFSPTTGHSIGMAYVNDGYNTPGTVLKVEIRTNLFDVTVVPKKDLLKV